MSRRSLALAAAAVALLGAAGCTAVKEATQAGARIAAEAGVITGDQAGSIERSAEAMARAFERITPEQEYYIGRAVGATLVKQYKPYDRPEANYYLNLLGQTLAQASEQPETFGGYRFLILDSEEINAFAAPGGFIFVTRGMLRCCPGESAVAAVLAHEIAHVQGRHGLQSIGKERMTAAVTTLAAEAGRQLAGEDVKELAGLLEGSISDITSTLVQSGYSRRFEREADLGAIAILRRLGYSPEALVVMLEEMGKRLQPGGPDFARTHPSPKDRVAEIRKATGPAAPAEESVVMQRRFAVALEGI